MAKQPRENRVPIMMSEAELEAIDTWRFANRVATRSDAVRRLAQIGLRADARAVEIATAARETFDAARELWSEMLDDLQAGRANREDAARTASALLGGAASKSLAALEAATALVEDVNAFHAITGAEDEIARVIEARAKHEELVEASKKSGIFE